MTFEDWWKRKSVLLTDKARRNMEPEVRDAWDAAIEEAAKVMCAECFMGWLERERESFEDMQYDKEKLSGDEQREEGER